MRNIKKVIGSYATVFFLGLCLSTQAMASPQGKIDFDDLSDFYGEPKVEVNLSTAMLGLVAAFAAQEEPEFAELAAAIESIKIRVYSLNGETKKAMTMVDTVSKKIRKDNWEPIVSVNEENEKIRIFTRMTNEVMDGLVVMVVDSQDDQGEAVFINIVGEIDPAKLSTLTKSLDINIGDQL